MRGPLQAAVVITLSVAALGASAVGAQSGDQTWNVADHVAPDAIIVQSHRGAGFLAEENTLPAFELGWSMGTWPEADVRTTTDGVIVAFHDADFSRVVKDASPDLAKKGVEHVTWELLSRLDVGSWKGERFKGRRVTRISEVFAIMKGRPDRHLYLDIKSVDLRKLAAEVREFGVGSQVVLASPRHEVIREWKSLVPESGTLLWMRGTDQSLGKRVADIRKAGFEGVTQLQVHIFPSEDKAGPEPFKISRAFVRSLGTELRQRGILFQALPYTDDRTVYAKLMDLGLASFSSDYPDVAKDEIRAYSERRKSRGR